ncbi:MAG: hypothetical protein K8S27_09780 [Candidatus Omnitrophica bacterium]|nr:hypothetical protein [Candidatus Omnitrophota bacterium]
MKKILLYVIFLSICLMSACGPVTTNKFQFNLKTNEFTHGHSNLRFPEQIGKFVRGRINQYDPDGKDISVTYNIHHPQSAVIATIYIHPAPMLSSTAPPQDVAQRAHVTIFEQYVASVKKETLHAHPDAELLKQGQKTLQIRKAIITGVCVKYRLKTLAGQAIDTFLEMYVFQFGPWIIKYSITYPQENQDLANQEITPFIDQFQMKR